MDNRNLYKNKIRNLIIIILISITAGAIYTSAVDGLYLDITIKGGIIGLLIGGNIGWFELFIHNKISQRFNLLTTVIIKSLFYSFFIIGSLLLNSYHTLKFSSIKGIETLADILKHPSFRLSIYFSIAVAVIIMTFMSINELIGRGILLKFLLGSYHKPKEEKKIFMFIDLKNSTEIAEKIGHKQFMFLIKDLFFDMSSPVLSTKGEIYKYVGDEAIITWDYKKGLKNSNCIEFFYCFKAVIESKRDYYLKKYGIYPSFKAGLHGGCVITGEIGTFKKEITYLGDVVNTTARIEGQCNILKSEMLISDELFNVLILPKKLSFIKHKDISLRGKSESVSLYSVISR